MQAADSLINELRNGSINAFEEIYKLYSGRLERFALNYLIDAADVDDVVQNVFKTLWEKRETLRSDCKLVNFLLVITKNQCISKLREYKTRLGYSNKLTEEHKSAMLNIFSLKQLQEDKLMKFDLDSIIRKALDSLPENCRQVFIKCKFEGFKYREIADMYNISEKTVEKRMTICLKALRLALKEKLYMLLL